MPCYMTGSAEGDRAYAQHEAGTDREQLLELSQKLTRMLCSLCREIEMSRKHGTAVDIPTEVAVWWRAHKAVDEARIERENRAALAAAERQRQEKLDAATRERALAKLSFEERKALRL